MECALYGLGITQLKNRWILRRFPDSADFEKSIVFVKNHIENHASNNQTFENPGNPFALL